jgi:large repetitive protein
MDMTFSGTVGQRVSLLTQPNWGCASLTVMNPNGTTLYTNWVCNTDYSGVLVLPTTGTYSIVVNLAGTETGAGTYTLYNIPANVSGSINIGDPASSYTTTVPSQAIQVSFTGAAGQSATVHVAVVSATPSSPCYLITTLEPDGVTVLRGDQSCNSGYSSGSLSLPQSGTYTVVVAPSNLAIGTFSVGVTTP